MCNHRIAVACCTAVSAAAHATARYPSRVVERCHNYDVDFKYKYTCMTCGRVYGRHSKSIDTTAKRCGVPGCLGMLMLLQGAAATAEDKPGPAQVSASAAAIVTAAMKTPAAPSAYQQFVKDNRLRVKTEQPTLTPAQVLAELGRQWTATKAARAATPATATGAAMPRSTPFGDENAGAPSAAAPASSSLADDDLAWLSHDFSAMGVGATGTGGRS